MRDRIARVGNINNPVTLLEGKPEDVRKETYLNLAAGVELIGPECAIPLTTPFANLREIPSAVRDWYRDAGKA